MGKGAELVYVVEPCVVVVVVVGRGWSRLEVEPDRWGCRYCEVGVQNWVAAVPTCDVVVGDGAGGGGSVCPESGWDGGGRKGV